MLGVSLLNPFYRWGAPRSSFADFESSLGTETNRVRIADWRSGKDTAHRKRKRYQNKKTKTAFKEKHELKTSARLTIPIAAFVSNAGSGAAVF